jgi:hypothetical protein
VPREQRRLCGSCACHVLSILFSVKIITLCCCSLTLLAPCSKLLCTATTVLLVLLLALLPKKVHCII